MLSVVEMQKPRQHAKLETGRMFEASPDLLCIIGFDGRFKRINTAFERTLGYSKEELLSRSGFDLTHPDDLESSRHVFAALTQGRMVEQFENRNVRADGSVIWIEWSARAMPEEELVFAVGRDVTISRRAAEEQAALRRVATLVARAVAPDLVFAAVAEEAGRLTSADIALIARYGEGPSATGIVGWCRDGRAIPLGRDVPLGGENVATVVHNSGRPARVGNYDKRSGDAARWAHGMGINSSVGVPITLEGRLWGVMTVSNESDEPLPADTEIRLAGFTDLAATAIANTEAREELRRFAAEQSGLRRVATLVAQGVAPKIVFDAVAEEVAKILGIALASVARYVPGPSIEFVGGWSSVGEPNWVGETTSIAGRNVVTAVFETGEPARDDRVQDDDAPLAAVARRAGARSTAGAPITVEGRLWGVMIVASDREDALPPGIEHELAGFTDLIATAIANTEARDELAASRARIVASADETRRRIVRDLHDGAQQRLVHAIITLKLAQRAQDAADDDAARSLVTEALGHAEGANSAFRELVQGIMPSVLGRGGLAAGINELSARMRLPVNLKVTTERFPAPIEATAYFVIAEALTNVAKHSRAQTAEVFAAVVDNTLTVEVRDDGTGGARANGSGLSGLADRVAALGGQLTIQSPDRGGTRVTATLPLPD